MHAVPPTSSQCPPSAPTSHPGHAGLHLSKRRQTFAAPALSKTNLLAAAAEAAARGAAEGDGGLINYVGLTDTCDEKGIDVFGAPALAQLDVAMKEITALLEGALEKVKYDRGTAIERAANNPDHSARTSRLEGCGGASRPTCRRSGRRSSC